MAKKSSETNALGSVPLFEGFSGAELRKVAGLLKEDWFNKGEDIVTAEDAGGRFYVVVEGRAKVIVNARTVRTIGPGGYFGEMSLLDNEPRAATVRADTDVKTLWIGRLHFLSLLEDNWTMAKKVLADLSARVRQLDKTVH